MKRKIIQLFTLTLFFVSMMFFMNINSNAQMLNEIVYDKESIDCGAYFGTKCTGTGDGCTPKECKDEGLEP